MRIVLHWLVNAAALFLLPYVFKFGAIVYSLISWAIGAILMPRPDVPPAR